MSTLPLVLPLMMPSRHLMEKENILLFPPADRLPFLRESVWGKAKESCLGVRRPFPNTTLADMFIFWPVTRKKMVSVLFLTLSPCPRHCTLCLLLLVSCSPPSLENFQSSQVSLSKPLQKQVQVCFFLKERIRSNTVPVISLTIVGKALPLVLNSHKLTR